MPAAAAEPPLPAAAAETPATRCKPAARTALGVLAIALLIAASYLPTTRAGFLWDDVIFSEHQAVREWSDIWSIWFSPGHVQNEGHYWPVVYTSFWIEHKLWGLEPLGYHLVNVLLHLANSLLLWLALRRLVVPGAWLVAAVFAVHPLHVESVAWIIERKDLLSTLLYIAAVLAWLRFQATGGRRSYLLALGAFLAGLLSKSVVVTLPAALLILRWRQRGRLDLRDLLYMAPFAAVGLVTTLADYLFYSSRESVDIGLSAIERLLLAARALVFYASKLLWPHGLLGIYPRWDVSATDPLAWAYLALAVVVPALLWRVRNKIGRGPLAGVLFFAVTLAPALGFIDYGYMQFSFVADRFQYLAGIGLIAVVVGAGAAAAARLPRRGRVAALAVPAAVLVVLGVLTWRHAEIYRNDETFFRHIVSLNPTARGAYDNLNKHLNDQGRLEEFLTSARTALEHLPQDPTSNINYGLALVKSGQVDEGIAYYRRALELEPGNSRALDDLARLLGQTGRYDQALEVWRAAAAARPRQIRPHLSMGVIEQQRGNHQAAQRHYARALAIDPGDADTRHKLGVLDFDLGRYEAALDHFRAALELQAQDDLRARLHSGIGAALFRLDRPDQAVRSLQRALALDPSLREARDNLGTHPRRRRRRAAAPGSLPGSAGGRPRRHRARSPRRHGPLPRRRGHVGVGAAGPGGALLPAGRRPRSGPQVGPVQPGRAAAPQGPTRRGVAALPGRRGGPPGLRRAASGPGVDRTGAGERPGRRASLRRGPAPGAARQRGAAQPRETAYRDGGLRGGRRAPAGGAGTDAQRRADSRQPGGGAISTGPARGRHPQL